MIQQCSDLVKPYKSFKIPIKLIIVELALPHHKYVRPEVILYIIMISAIQCFTRLTCSTAVLSWIL